MGKRLGFIVVLAALLGGPSFAEEAKKGAAQEDKRPDVKATCTASCGSGSPVSCTVSSGTCTAVDRNCSAGQRGYVQCGATKTNCALACPVLQDCSANGICNMNCGVSDPDCIQSNPCVNNPARGCYYVWSPQTYCCLTNNAGCQDYCY